MIATWIGALSCLIWLGLVTFRGRFWQISTSNTGLELRSDSAPRVAVIMPARNETDVIGHAIGSLLKQDYAGPLQIFVVDDHSSDKTVSVVHEAASDEGERLTMISSTPLPIGWTGKTWALSQGIKEAAKFAPDFFLLSDADIIHSPDSIRSLVALAQSGDHDLVSMMAKLRCSSLAERALIPAFVYFFLLLYPPQWVGSVTHKTAAAAGGNILVRRQALERMGGVAAIRTELIDDCALAREIKRNGRVQLGLAQNACSIRSYAGFGGIGRMISRNAFYQLRHSVCLLIVTVVGLAITYLAPPIVVFFGGWATVCGGAAWLLMSTTFWPTLRFYSLPPLWAPLLPFVALFYTGATIHSAIQYWLGYGGEWKGRLQDARNGLLN